MMKYVLPPSLATLLLAVIAGVCVWTQQPLLAPSLGAAVFSQVLHSDEQSAAPYNLVAGQVVGGIAGFLGVYLAGQAEALPLVGTHYLPAGRVGAVAIAACLAIIGQMAVKARTPTGGATALVVALGVETPTFPGAVRLLAGIALVMILGEGARRLVLWAERAGHTSPPPRYPAP